MSRIKTATLCQSILLVAITITVSACKDKSSRKKSSGSSLPTIISEIKVGLKDPNGIYKDISPSELDQKAAAATVKRLEKELLQTDEAWFAIRYLPNDNSFAMTGTASSNKSIVFEYRKIRLGIRRSKLSSADELNKVDYRARIGIFPGAAREWPKNKRTNSAGPWSDWKDTGKAIIYADVSRKDGAWEFKVQTAPLPNYFVKPSSDDLPE